MSSIKSSCSRIWTQRKSKRTDIFYHRPTSKTDLKREGRVLIISDGNGSVSLNGSQINTLKGVLKDVGEVGRQKVNRRRVRIGTI